MTDYIYRHQCREMLYDPSGRPQRIITHDLPHARDIQMLFRDYFHRSEKEMLTLLQKHVSKVMPATKHQMASPAAVTGVQSLMIRIQDDMAYAQEFPISEKPADIAQLTAALAVWLGYEDTI